MLADGEPLHLAQIDSAPFTLAVSAAEAEASAQRVADAVPPGGVLYYALGGGMGHLARGLAIGRQYRRLRPDPFVLLTNCRARVPEPGIRLQLLDAPDPPPEALARLVRCLVRALQPAALVVDAFPAGILGELPPVLGELPCRRVAVLRRLQARWVERWRLPEVLQEHYHAAALVEPGAAFPGFPSPVPHRVTDPVLLRDAGELLTREEARERLRSALPGRPVVCAVVTGARPAELGLLRAARRAVGAASGEAVLRLVTPFPGSIELGERLDYFPLVELLPGVDLVIGPAGYNLYHETAATGTPAVFVPQRRLYDDQFARAESDGRPVARSPAELLEWVRRLLPAAPGERAAPAYRNGGMGVAELVAELAADL
jgi:hypothetical protein